MVWLASKWFPETRNLTEEESVDDENETLKEEGDAAAPDNTETEDQEVASPIWSLAGFEVFDLIVIASQVIIYFTSVSVGPILDHPLCRFLLGIGFVVTVFCLGRTRVYARGVQKIESEHSHLWTAIYTGGTVLGIIILTRYIFYPIKLVFDSLGLDDNWLSIPGVPLSVVALVFLPYMAIRAEKKDIKDKSHFVEYPVWIHYLGRAVLLLLANSIMYSVFREIAADTPSKTFSAIVVAVMFYFPVRLQEMFLRPDGPHFQSVFQTMSVLVVGSLGALFF